MRLGDVLYQGGAQRQIQRAVASGRWPHAVIFHGPEGVGKEMLAGGLAQLLVCGEPIEKDLTEADRETVGIDRLRGGCGQCEDCRAVVSSNHPDVHLIYRQLSREHPDPQVRARKAQAINVDVIRHFVIKRIGITPVRGRAKVFIIREADRMNPQAQNALLKSLEEPPAKTSIILLVRSLGRLLPTTLSRCQVVSFDALPAAFVASTLPGQVEGLTPAQADWYAHCGAGSLGGARLDAEDQLYEVNSRLVEGFLQLGVARSDTLVDAWTTEAKTLGDRYRKRDPDMSESEAARTGLKLVFKLAAMWHGDILRTACQSASTKDGGSIINAAWQSSIEASADRMDASAATDAIQRIAQAEGQLDLNANRPLVVETLLNDLTRLARGNGRGAS